MDNEQNLLKIGSRAERQSQSLVHEDSLMNILKFELPKFSWSESNYARDLLTMKRGRQRRAAHGHIVIETLRAITGGAPTKDELQKLSRIRRDRFIPVLKYLIGAGAVVRSGTGRKFDPFRFSLPMK